MLSPRASFGVAGAACLVGGVALVGVLHLVPPSDAVNPFTRTISEYALLSNGWVFDLAVLLIAAGSAVALVGLTAAGVARPASVGFFGLLLWSAGMAGVVLFPKHNWAVGPSPSGDLHRAASLVAFFALPVAALALGLAWRRHEQWRRHAYVSIALGLASLAAFSPLLYAIVSGPFTGVRWWRVFPLGVVERSLALTEVVTALAIAVWAARAGTARAGS